MPRVGNTGHLSTFQLSTSEQFHKICKIQPHLLDGKSILALGFSFRNSHYLFINVGDDFLCNIILWCLYMHASFGVAINRVNFDRFISLLLLVALLFSTFLSIFAATFAASTALPFFKFLIRLFVRFSFFD